MANELMARLRNTPAIPPERPYSAPPAPREQSMRHIEQDLQEALKDINKSELRKLARIIYDLRYGLMMQLAKELDAKLGTERGPEGTAKGLFDWADSKLNHSDEDDPVSA